MRDVILSIIAGILVISLIILFSCQSIKSNRTESIRNEIEINVSEYRIKKRKAEQDLTKLEKVHVKETVGASRLMLFFKSIDNLFMDEIYPIVDEIGAIGTLCLEKENLPGVYSPMTFEVYSSLIEKGWETAIYFDGKTLINEWATDNKKAFEVANIEMPKVLMLDEENFSEEKALEFYTLGFEDIVVKAKKPNISREDINDGPRVTDAVGWYTTTASGIIELFASKTGDIAFYIGGDHVEEKYEPEQFKTMFGTLGKSIEKEQLFFTTPFKTAEHKETLKENYERTIEEYNEEKIRLEALISELESLIQKEYDKYIGGE